MADQKWAVADFETTTRKWNEKDSFVAIWNVRLNENESKSDVNIMKMFQYLKQNNIKEVYFHNLDFDGKYIMDAFEVMKMTSLPVIGQYGWDSLEKYKDAYTALKDGKNIYSIKANLGEWTVEFKCSYLLLRSSIKSLGNELTKTTGKEFKKGDCDYHGIKLWKSIEEVPKEFIEYMENDTLIQYISLSNFKKAIPNHTLTSGGSAKYDFQMSQGGVKICNEKYGWNTLNLGEYLKIRQSFFGGLSSVHERFKGKMFLEPMVYLDTVSLYPFSMTKYLPYGSYTSFEGRKSQGPKELSLFFIEVYKITKKQENMFNHFHRPQALQRGEFRSEFKDPYIKNYNKEEHLSVSYWQDEWDELLLTYDIEYKILQTYIFKSEPYYKEWIEKWFWLKKKGGALRNAAKIFLNAGYGKHSENPEKTITTTYIPYYFEKFFNETSNFFDPKETDTRIGGELEYNIKYMSDKIPYIPLASYITSASRCHLIRAVRKNQENYVCGDTDSIILKCPLDKVQGLKIGKDLGDWNVEHEITQFKSLRPKCYILFNNKNEYKRTIAGMGNEEVRKTVNFSNFELNTLWEKGNKRAIYGENFGVFIDEVDFTLKGD